MSVSTEPASTGAVSMRDLLEAGVHFGHQTRRWNPKMRRFIFAERGGIYIIDLTQTAERLDEAQQFLRNVAERAGTVLFVGTKKQAQDAVEQEAKRIGMPYVNHRWLGGLLTNWRTMADRIDRLHELRRQREEGQLELLPAKERIAMAGELEKLEANLGGVADMRRQPDAVVIIDLKKEALGVREARRLGIPVVALVDTNCDPDEADYVIPGNDDAIRSCNLVVHALAEAISDGKQKISVRELEQQPEPGAETVEAAPADDVEDVSAGETIEPVTEGESVPVPTGEDPAKEGAEETKRSAAALGDPTLKAGSVAGEADDAPPEEPAASGGLKAGSVAGRADDARPEDPAASGGLKAGSVAGRADDARPEDPAASGGQGEKS